MTGLISIAAPVLLHMAASNAAALVWGQSLDAASCTTIAALVVLPFAWAMYRSDRKAEKRIFPGNEPVRRILYGVFCIAAGGVLNLAWSAALNAAGIHEAFSNETQEALLSGSAAVQAAGLCFFVPLAEELIFRGLVYRRMKRYCSVKAAAVLSSLLFAVYHGNPIQIIFAFPMALALAAVYEQGKLFLYPVLFHMGSNGTAVIFSSFF